MKFLVDMPVTPEAADALERAGHEAVHASRIGLSTAEDSTILERALADNRVVVTADLDFPRLLALTKARSPGLILFRGGTLADKDLIALLGKVVARAGDLDLEHSIVVIEPGRIRRRPLPIEQP